MYYSYESLIASVGTIEIVEAEYAGSYQGDLFLVVRATDTGDYGFTVIGYGSCSGCDALEAAHDDDRDWSLSYAEREKLPMGKNVEALRDSLLNDIKWFSSLHDVKLHVRRMVDERSPNSWYWHDDEFKAWAEKFTESV